MFRILQLLERDEDKDYVRHLYKRMEHKLFRIARSILGNNQDAEDVVQESFCGLIDRMDVIPREQLDAEAYLVASVRNNACKLYNRKKGQKTTAISGDEFASDNHLLEHCMLQELKPHIMRLDIRSRKVVSPQLRVLSQSKTLHFCRA